MKLSNEYFYPNWNLEGSVLRHYLTQGENHKICDRGVLKVPIVHVIYLFDAVTLAKFDKIPPEMPHSRSKTRLDLPLSFFSYLYSPAIARYQKLLNFAKTKGQGYESELLFLLVLLTDSASHHRVYGQVRFMNKFDNFPKYSNFMNGNLALKLKLWAFSIMNVFNTHHLKIELD